MIDTSHGADPTTGASAATAAIGITSGDSLISDTGSRPRGRFMPGYVPAGSSAPIVLPADLDSLRRQGMVIPVAGVQAKDLVDSFDDKRGGTRTHNALDIMAARNTPAIAATSGTIVRLHNSAAGGLTVYMSDASGRFVMMYGHLDSFRPGLKEGTRVRRGEIIGFVGTTGNASALAPHLHFQVTRNDNLREWWKGTPLNPFLIYRPA